MAGVRKNTTSMIWMQTQKTPLLHQDNWTHEAMEHLKVSQEARKMLIKTPWHPQAGGTCRCDRWLCRSVRSVEKAFPKRPSSDKNIFLPKAIEIELRIAFHSQYFETEIHNLMKNKGWDGYEPEANKTQWTFSGSLFYSIIVSLSHRRYKLNVKHSLSLFSPHF